MQHLWTKSIKNCIYDFRVGKHVLLETPKYPVLVLIYRIRHKLLDIILNSKIVK